MWESQNCLAPKLIKLLHSWGRLGFFSMSFLPHVDHPSCHHKFDWPTPNRSDTLLPLVHGSSMPYSHVFGSRKIHAAAPRTRFWTSLPCNFPTVLAAAPISLCLGIYFIKKKTYHRIIACYHDDFANSMRVCAKFAKMASRIYILYIYMQFLCICRCSFGKGPKTNQGAILCSASSSMYLSWVNLDLRRCRTFGYMIFQKNER